MITKTAYKDIETKQNIEVLKAELRTYREQVVFLYNHFPETILSDNLLIEKYEDNFYYSLASLKATAIGTITRWGRYLRENFPERYNRNEVQTEIEAKQEAFKEVMVE